MEGRFQSEEKLAVERGKEIDLKKSFRKKICFNQGIVAFKLAWKKSVLLQGRKKDTLITASLQSVP